MRSAAPPQGARFRSAGPFPLGGTGWGRETVPSWPVPKDAPMSRESSLCLSSSPLEIAR